MTTQQNEIINELTSLIEGPGCDVACLLDLLADHPGIDNNTTLMGAVNAIKTQHMAMLNKATALLDAA